MPIWKVAPWMRTIWSGTEEVGAGDCCEKQAAAARRNARKMRGCVGMAGGGGGIAGLDEGKGGAVSAGAGSRSTMVGLDFVARSLRYAARRSLRERGRDAAL